MTDADVAQYLQEHPEFLDAHADILAKINIPDPHEGRAISLAERQMSQLRDRVSMLEDKLTELIAFGEENDAIGERMHRVTLALLTAASLRDVLRVLAFHLLEDFSVPHVAVRIWRAGDQPDIDIFAEVSDEVHAFTQSLKTPYCATHPVLDSIQWFADTHPDPQSFAYVRLEGGELSGLMMLASENPHRFYPEMGTLYLQRLGDTVSAAIARYLT
jgi:uncharacterized protein